MSVQARVHVIDSFGYTKLETCGTGVSAASALVCSRCPFGFRSTKVWKDVHSTRASTGNTKKDSTKKMTSKNKNKAHN